MTMRMVVVFPAPLGPMNPYSPPRGTSRSSRSTAVNPPNVLVTPVMRMAVSMDQGSPTVAGQRSTASSRVS